MNNIYIRQLTVFISSVLALTLLAFILSSHFKLDIGDNSASLLNHYFHYMMDIFSGNWGYSSSSGSSVFTEFINHLPATIELSACALIMAVFIGIPLGVIAATNKGKWQDKLITSTTLMGYSIPIFWWGILLILFFSFYLQFTPVGGRLGFEYDIQPQTGFMLIDTLLSEQPYALQAFFDALRHLLLPAMALGTIPLAILTKVTRSAMLQVLSSNFIRTAKAKGLSSNRIIWLHATRNALLPILTNIELQISLLITGTLITEIIFSWPGVGKWLLEAVLRRDYATIHGGILAMSLLILANNLLIETLSYYANPKAKLPT